VKDIQECLNADGNTISNQLGYSLLFRAIEYDILPLCIQKNIPVLCYSPMMQGLLTGKFADPEDVPKGRARTRLFPSDKMENPSHSGPGCLKEAFEAIDEIRKIADEMRKPMAHVSIAWILAQPGVACVIAGAKNPAQVTENVKAVNVDLQSEVVERLALVTESVKKNLGGNADMWSDRNRIQ
jgi:aryl-alcohol dehydrogenase-like predicted oxidoreductase